MKKNFILITAAILVIMSAFTVYSTQETDSEETQVFQSSRPASAFDHDEHNSAAELEDDCALCHHVYEGKTLIEGESSEDSPCSECHEAKATEENGVPLRTAFHKRCKTCHFDAAKGPVLCGECHIKQ